MSKKNRRIINTSEAVESQKAKESLGKKDSEGKKSFWKGLGGIEKLGVFGLCLLLAVGVLGSGLGDSIINAFAGDDSTSKASANNRSSSNKSETSLLSKLNPFAAEPMPSNTPQLSKEYIYAGSRLLAVEDANATAAPPADLAIWRPSTGQWLILRSEDSSFYGFPFGTSTDIPSPGDYDGDGQFDAAVFRPSTNTWFYNGTTSGNVQLNFGVSGDVPIPNVYSVE